MLTTPRSDKDTHKDKDKDRRNILKIIVAPCCNISIRTNGHRRLTLTNTETETKSKCSKIPIMCYTFEKQWVQGFKIWRFAKKYSPEKWSAKKNSGKKYPGQIYSNNKYSAKKFIFRVLHNLVWQNQHEKWTTGSKEHLRTGGVAFVILQLFLHIGECYVLLIQNTVGIKWPGHTFQWHFSIHISRRHCFSEFLSNPSVCPSVHL